MNDELKKKFPDGSTEVSAPGTFELTDEINSFLSRFETDAQTGKVISNGLFGYFTHEAVEHFETIKLKETADNPRKIPVMQYHIYSYIIAVDHFKNELYIFHNQVEGQPETNGLEKLEYLIKNKNFPEYTFESKEAEQSNLTNEEFIAIVEKMKTHIYRGDVFPDSTVARIFAQVFGR
jgi:anthranilate synthase component 1